MIAIHQWRLRRGRTVSGGDAAGAIGTGGAASRRRERRWKVVDGASVDGASVDGEPLDGMTATVEIEPANFLAIAYEFRQN